MKLRFAAYCLYAIARWVRDARWFLARREVEYARAAGRYARMWRAWWREEMAHQWATA